MLHSKTWFRKVTFTWKEKIAYKKWKQCKNCPLTYFCQWLSLANSSKCPQKQHASCLERKRHSLQRGNIQRCFTRKTEKEESKDKQYSYWQSWPTAKKSVPALYWRPCSSGTVASVSTSIDKDLDPKNFTENYWFLFYLKSLVQDGAPRNWVRTIGKYALVRT